MLNLYVLLYLFSNSRKAPAPVALQVALPPAEPRKPAPNPLLQAWTWFCATRAKSADKRMRLEETVSLGDKRIIALIQVDGRRFLVGGGPSGVSLLTPLGGEQDFSTMVRQGLETK